MKIRARITLFIVLSGLVASLLLAVWLIYELLEQPFQILDTSLREESERAVRMLSQELEKFPSNTLPQPDDIGVPQAIWMEIRDASNGEILYRSPLAGAVDLNPAMTEASDAEKQDAKKTVLAAAFRHFRRSPEDQAIYRTKNFEIAHDDETFLVYAARSMKKLDEEIREVFWVAVANLIFITLILVGIGWVLAGKILRPIEDMILLTQKISDKNLTERVPVGGERDELAELAETLNRMLDRLQISFARQKELLFDTSHELKTPLTTIRLAVEEMSAGGDSLQSEEMRASIFRLEGQTLRMERLVKSLLNLSSLEALHVIERNPVGIDALLLSLVDEYSLLADAENISVEVDIREGLVMLGDEEKLRRAFSNILDNAIKYNSEQGGERLITVSAKESADRLTIAVSNTGEALSEDESTRVFDQFYRVEKSRSLRRGGSGLGLAIVKKTVELHRGEVRFESAVSGVRNMNNLIVTFERE